MVVVVWEGVGWLWCGVGGGGVVVVWGGCCGGETGGAMPHLQLLQLFAVVTVTTDSPNPNPNPTLCLTCSSFNCSRWLPLRFAFSSSRLCCLALMSSFSAACLSASASSSVMCLR